ncbi:dynamin family protein [Nocardioides marmoraquaticus]
MARETTAMLETLGSLRVALDEIGLPLDLPDAAAHRRRRSEVAHQLDDYVVPRLEQIDAPLLAVVGGSTGAGKSTLVNALVRDRVSEPGVLRPTTRSPVLVHHPDDLGWFDRARVLPDLERTERASDDPGALRLVASSSLPVGLALLDAPDIDSVEERNRTLAAQLLGAADLWLFVTSAARYADQVPWEFLRQAVERSAAVAIVLDRTPEQAAPEVAHDLARMLVDRGLRESPLFTVVETPLGADGLLPADAVADVRDWLVELGADAEARQRVVRQTLAGAVRSVAREAFVLAQAEEQQVEALGRLHGETEAAYARAVEAVDDGTADGTLLRGEVLARWQDFVGTGELLRSLESRVGRLRDRITGALRGKPQQADRVTVAVESGLHSLLVEHAESAAERAEAAWRADVSGRALLDAAGPGDLGRASRGCRERAERLVRDWQQAVLELVRAEGAGKRSTARFLAFGVNGLAVSLMVVTFASTGGLVGAEIGIAGGSAVVGQKLLEAVFGDQAVRRLAAAARADLRTRVEELMAAERRRFDVLLDAQPASADAAARLRTLARRLDDQRFSGISTGASTEEGP